MKIILGLIFVMTLTFLNSIPIVFSDMVLTQSSNTSVESTIGKLESLNNSIHKNLDKDSLKNCEAWNYRDSLGLLE